MSARAASIARPIFLLVLAAILLATAVTFAITFGGPPPRPRPVPDADIVAALNGARVPGLVTLPGRATSRAGERPGFAHDAALTRALGLPVTGSYAQPERGGPGEVRGGFTVSALTPDGWVSAHTPVRPAVTSWHLVTFGGMATLLLLLSVPAWVIARRISRPLDRLAAAARGARVGAPIETPPGGSREVRELGEALADLHARIGRHAEGRTAMLAAIAHDLGTPLSRLAFHVEGLPEAARARAASDIDEMRAMIAAAIGFARDEAGSGATRRVDLGSLIDTLADDMRAAGDDVDVAPGPRAVVSGDPAALRRLFANVLGNAVRYGTRARVGWNEIEGTIEVTVADDGPGVDPARAERLFEPFVRGEPSRNRITGGAGLGLAIARAIAARHGGTVDFRPSERGARVRVALPAEAY